MKKIIIMKQLLKKVVQKFGYDIIKQNNFSEATFQTVLDAVINTKKYFGEEFTLLQIGANDGVTNDPINHFLQKNNGNAILVEPIPDVFEKLKKNYSRKDIKLVNAAIYENDTNVPMYRISPKLEEKYKSLYKANANASGITSLNKEHVENFLIKIAPKYFDNHNIDEWIEETTVPGMTFKTLVSTYQISTIDILQIDTEGYDFEVLKMAFASKISEPIVINFEYKNLNSIDVDMAIKLLNEKNYCTFKHEGNICAYINYPQNLDNKYN
jgi:FkbM family methyltransferase